MEFTKKNTLAMKGIAIIMMLFHHCFLTGRYESFNIIFTPFTEGFTVKIASFFKICVAIYVFLTGYGLMIKHLKNNEAKENKESQPKMIAKRYLSLVAGFLIIFLMCQIFSMIMDRGPLKTYSSDTIYNGILNFVIDGLGLANLFGTPTLNGTWWYMSLAIVLIAVIPIMIKIYKKFGFLATSIILITIAHVIEIPNTNMVRWLYTAFLGIVCADKNLLVKMKDFKLIKKNDIVNKIVKFVIATILVVGSVYLRQGADPKYYELNDALIPVFIIYYCFEFIMPIKYINNALMFLGKHSTNIFLTHTFVRAIYFENFTYSFKYPVVIVAVLLGISLIISIIIELIKKYSGYNKLIEKVKSKI